MTTIAYDRPMKDLVAQLSATGHVSHRAYKKTSVTFHHNAGRLSHEGVLSVWKVRPASAHFDIDRAGAACQYVKVNEYAWATGSTTGNQTSISIELANAALAPTWEVSEVTWMAGARLAGWLFAKVIGAAPTDKNVFMHSHWASTACAGPWVKKIFGKLLAEVQRWYKVFKQAAAPAPRPPASPLPSGVDRPTYAKIAVDGDLGPATIGAWQRVMKTARDGKISRPSMLIKAVQHVVGFSGANVDGLPGPRTWRAIQRRLGVTQSGRPDSKTIRALQIRLNTNRF